MSRKTLIIFLNIFLTSVCAYISMYFIAHYLGPTAVGKWGYVLSILGLFAFIGDFGFSKAHIKKISEGLDETKCLGTFLRIKGVLLILYLSILIIAFFVIKDLRNSKEMIYLFIFLLINQLLVQSSIFFTATLTGKIKMFRQYIPMIISNVITTILKVVFLFVFLNIVYIALGQLIGTIILIIIFIFMFRNKKIGSFDKEYFKKYLHFALPTMLLAIITTIAIHIDKIMLKLFYDFQDVGFYYASQRIIQILLMLPISLSNILLPYFSKLHSNNKIKKIKEITFKLEKYLIIFASISIMIILLNEDFIIKVLLGEKFIEIKPILNLLLYFSFLGIINQPFVIQFPATNKPKLGILPTIQFNVLNILLNMYFIPQSIFGIKVLGLGAQGAALATLISYSIHIVIIRYYTAKLTNSFVNRKNILMIILSIIMFLVFKFIFGYFEITGFLNLIISSFSIVIVFLGTNILLKTIDKKDLIVIKELLNIKSLKEEIKEEMK